MLNGFAVLAWPDWRSKVPRAKAYGAASLLLFANRAKTLADVVRDGAARNTDIALGQGHFGQVQKYEHLGAPWAVKGLRAGANKETIGAWTDVALRVVWSASLVLEQDRQTKEIRSCAFLFLAL